MSSMFLPPEVESRYIRICNCNRFCLDALCNPASPSEEKWGNGFHDGKTDFLIFSQSWGPTCGHAGAHLNFR